MKKYQFLKFLVAIIIILSSTLIYSAPIQNYPIKLSQPDGSIINCFVSGDEYFNYYHTEDGYFIKKGSDGYYYFANQENENDNEIYTTNYKVDSYNPNDLNISKWLKPNVGEMNSLIKKKQANYKKFDNVNLQYKLEGTLNNIVIFIRFADDDEYTDSFQFYDSLLNDKNNISMRNYYLEASYNYLDIVSHIYPATNTTILSYQDNQKREFYTPYDQYTNPKGYQNYEQSINRELGLIARAIKFVAPQIPKDIDFDLNGDGYVDNINFIIKGEPTAWGTLLWPHAFAELFGDNTINDLMVGVYNINLSNLTRHPTYGLGTICHEFFHTLGCPDMYHHSSDGKAALGRWDVMDQTANPPQMMCNFLKSQYTGWIEDIPLITKEGKYELKPTSSPTESIYKIEANNSNKEYFILEYRKREGKYDSQIPGTGLLIYRVNSELQYRGNRNGPPDEIYLYRPDGNMDKEGALPSANFCKEAKRTSIGKYTNPNLFLSSGSTSDIEIFNISECGETISFEVSYTVRTAFIEPANRSVDLELNPKFVWHYIADAKLYSIEIASDYDFNDIVFKRYDFDATAIKLGDILLRGKTYYARVRWSSDSKTSAWSDVLEFSTIQAPTQLISPSNLSTEVSIFPKFNWEENINNQYYKIQVSEFDDFSKNAFSRNLIHDTTIESNKPLKLNTKYYWRVISKSILGLETESPVFSFITKENEIAGAKYSASQDVCEREDINLFVQTYGSEAKYKWYFNNQELLEHKDSTYLIEEFSTQNEGTYKCIAYNDELGLSYEFPELTLNTINFDSFDYIPRITSGSSDVNIVLSVKIDKEFSDLNKSFLFRWLKGDVALSDGVVYKGTKTPNLTINDGANQDIDSLYRLRIISRCDDTLTTMYYSKIVGVEDIINDENKIEIYPNPAKEQFEIVLDNEINNNTIIRIYNSYGELVYENLNLLANRLLLNTEKFATGTYFIEVYNGNTIIRRKFIVLK